MLRVAKWRLVATLAVCQALMTTVIAMTQSLVSIEARSLTGGESLSGSGLAAQLAGAIVALIVLQHVVGQRRRSLVLCAGFGALTLGVSVGAVGIAARSLPLFLAGNAILGAGAATALLLRSLVADAVSVAEEGRAIAIVASAGVAGAVLSPVLIAHVANHVGVVSSDRAVAPWAVAALVAGVGLAIAVSVRVDLPASEAPPLPPETVAPAAPDATRTVMAATSAAGIAMVAMMATVAVHLQHIGASRTAISAIMAAHFAGMYGFAIPFGELSDRFGKRVVLVVCSLLVTASALAFAADPHQYAVFGVILLTLGAGWSGIFVASTALFTAAGRFERRSRAIARNDLVVVVLSSAAAFLGGAIYARAGALAIGLSIAMVFAFVAVGTRLYERAG